MPGSSRGLTACAITAATVLTAPAALAQNDAAPLLAPALRDLFHEALSGETAKEHVIAVTRHHRIQGSRGFRDASDYVRDQLHAAGFSKADAYVESFRSDGRIAYQTWQSPSGWHIERAELRMMEPRNERIVGYPEIAMSVMTYSNAGDVTAELVWVGAGTRDEDYAGKDVKGKIVLCTGYGGAVHRLAVLKYGAAAAVCYLDDERAREYPDMLQYTGMWPKTEELERVTFGFNLTNRQGERLRELLASGQRVVLRAKVEGPGLESFFMDLPVAVIRGTEHPEQEIVFTAHLDHPKESANDNASGSAAMLDIATTLRRLIDEKHLAAPKRTLRFIWIPEWNGTMAYIDAHPELRGPALGGTVLANINLDMVGENLELLHSKLILTRVPASIPSVLDDVIAAMAEMVDGMEVRTPRGSLSAPNYRIVPYRGGSDHMMFIDRDVPGVMFSHDPDYTHHTSEDTPDKVDPVELERSEIIATGAGWYLANLSDLQAADLAWLASAEAVARVARAARRAREVVSSPPERHATNGASLDPGVKWAEAQNVLDRHADWERQHLESVLHFRTGPAGAAAVRAMTAQLEAQRAAFSRELAATARASGARGDRPQALPDRDRRVPERITRGPLDFALPESRLAADAAAWYTSPEFPFSSEARFELVNFIDGRKSVAEIRDALSAEFGPVPTGAVARYLDDLVRVGVIRWK